MMNQGHKTIFFIGFGLIINYYTFAMYDTHTGRFMQQDPIGYTDGMNLYEYAQSEPAIYLDPSGKTVRIACNARQRLQAKLKEASVSGYTLNKKGSSIYEYSGKNVQFLMDGSNSEIIGSMIKSDRLFTIKGNIAESAMRNFERHVDARRYTIDAAKTKRFGFTTDKISVNEIFWNREIRYASNGSIEYRTTVKGDDIAGAIADIWSNPGKYEMACQAGTAIVMLRGISQAMGDDDFNAIASKSPLGGKEVMNMLKQDNSVEEDDWIPGDWGYVENTQFDGRIGLEGENIIYIGRSQWWGHLRNEPLMLSLKGENGWLKQVESWNGGALILESRRYPKLGLE